MGKIFKIFASAISPRAQKNRCARPVYCVAVLGFEPRLSDSKSLCLPLADSALLINYLDYYTIIVYNGKMSNTKTKRSNYALPENFYQQVKSTYKQAGYTTMNGLITDLVRRWLEQNGPKQPQGYGIANY